MPPPSGENIPECSCKYAHPTASVLMFFTFAADHLCLDQLWKMSLFLPVSEVESLPGNVLHLLPVKLPSGITQNQVKLVTALNFTLTRASSDGVLAVNEHLPTLGTAQARGQRVHPLTVHPRLNLISEFIDVHRGRPTSSGSLKRGGKTRRELPKLIRTETERR